MVDLNHILLFLAVVSPLAVLGRAWRPGPTYRGWRIAALVVLLITGLSFWFFRSKAGYIGGGAWFVLLLLPALGMRRISELAARQEFRSARRLARALFFLHPSEELHHQVELLRTLESRQMEGGSALPLFPQPEAANRRWRLHRAPAVSALILINIAAFLPEHFGTLYQLGALEPDYVVRGHQYWRLLTALFLHADIVHLLFNLFALYVLGPPLERAIGAVRFCACYLLSGLGSTAGVVVLWMLRLNDTMQLVGASGCIMGIVGAWAAFLLRHRHMPLAKERLTNVAMIVAIQVAFDIYTPQVSSSAHLCGLVAGFAVGLVMAPRKNG